MEPTRPVTSGSAEMPVVGKTSSQSSALGHLRPTLPTSPSRGADLPAFPTSTEDNQIQYLAPRSNDQRRRIDTCPDVIRKRRKVSNQADIMHEPVVQEPSAQGPGPSSHDFEDALQTGEQAASPLKEPAAGAETAEGSNRLKKVAARIGKTKRNAKPLTKDQERRVGELLESKMPYRKIAENQGITIDQVNNVVARLGKTKKIAEPLTQDQEKRVAELLESKIPYRKIAENQGITFNQVKSVATRLSTTKKNAKPLTKDIEKRVGELIDSKMPYMKIVENQGITLNQVKKVAVRLSKTKKIAQPLTKDIEKRVGELLDNKMPYMKIVENQGITLAQVKKAAARRSNMRTVENVSSSPDDLRQAESPQCLGPISPLGPSTANPPRMPAAALRTHQSPRAPIYDLHPGTHAHDGADVPAGGDLDQTIAAYISGIGTGKMLGQSELPHLADLTGSAILAFDKYQHEDEITKEKQVKTRLTEVAFPSQYTLESLPICVLNDQANTHFTGFLPSCYSEVICMDPTRQNLESLRGKDMPGKIIGAPSLGNNCLLYSIRNFAHQIDPNWDPFNGQNHTAIRDNLVEYLKNLPLGDLSSIVAAPAQVQVKQERIETAPLPVMSHRAPSFSEPALKTAEKEPSLNPVRDPEKEIKRIDTALHKLTAWHDMLNLKMESEVQPYTAIGSFELLIESENAYTAGLALGRFFVDDDPQSAQALADRFKQALGNPDRKDFQAILQIKQQSGDHYVSMSALQKENAVSVLVLDSVSKPYSPLYPLMSHLFTVFGKLLADSAAEILTRHAHQVCSTIGQTAQPFEIKGIKAPFDGHELTIDNAVVKKGYEAFIRQATLEFSSRVHQVLDLDPSVRDAILAPDSIEKALKQLPAIQVQILCTNVQVSPIGCRIFALSFSKKMHGNPLLEKLHMQNLKRKAGKPSCQIGVLAQNNVYTKLADPRFYKHATTQKVVNSFLEKNKNLADTPVDKLGRSLGQYWQAFQENFMTSSDHGTHFTERPASSSIQQKELKLIGRSIEYFKARKQLLEQGIRPKKGQKAAG